MSERDRPSRPGGIAPALATFLELFRQGRYWESHEVLEGPWRDQGSSFYKGLILYASAFVHVHRDNEHGIEAQLAKAVAQLEPFAPEYLGFDVDGILAHADRCRAVVAAHAGAPPELWPTLVPRPVLRWDRARVRGDEPELGAAVDLADSASAEGRE